MNPLHTLLMGIITILIWVLGFLAVAIFSGFIFTGIAFLISAIFILWMLGLPIVIKKSGVKVGYVRWFKFHRTI